MRHHIERHDIKEFNRDDVTEDQIVLELNEYFSEPNKLELGTIVVLSKRDYKNLKKHTTMIKQSPSLLKLNSDILKQVYELCDDTITYQTMMMMNESVDILKTIKEVVYNIHRYYKYISTESKSEMN